MPQMSPINWLMTTTIFILILSIMIIKNYFFDSNNFSLNNDMKQNNQTFFTFKKMNVWMW